MILAGDIGGANTRLALFEGTEHATPPLAWWQQAGPTWRDWCNT